MKSIRKLQRRKKRRLLASKMITGACIAALLIGAGSRWGGVIAYADKTAQDKLDEAQDALDDTNQHISDIENQKDDVEQDITEAEDKLKVLLDNTEKLKEQIAKTQEEVDRTNLELEKAKETEADQYEKMKLRIQYMYENQAADTFWGALLESKGFSDMLNRLEYVARVYESDRELMDRYEEAVEVVTQKTDELADQMDQLLAQQEIFLAQQTEIEELIAGLQDQKDTYTQQLAEARQQAAEYRKTIEEQTEIIAKLEEERKRREEEERKRKEEEERKRQEEEEKKRQEEEAQQNKDDEDTSPDDSPSNGSGVTGEEVVAYARQFVGNPYVWGGNSLTNGCDCSGFVHLVYKHFGISTPRYSQSFANVGVAVDESDMQPGDIIVYPPGSNGVGHVAIYIGNGCIVEAQSSNAGITDDRAYNRRTIKAIRRVI